MRKRTAPFLADSEVAADDERRHLPDRCLVRATPFYRADIVGMQQTDLVALAEFLQQFAMLAGGSPAKSGDARGVVDRGFKDRDSWGFEHLGVSA